MEINMPGPEGHIGLDSGYWSGCNCAGCKAYRYYYPEQLTDSDRIKRLEERVKELEKRGG